MTPGGFAALSQVDIMFRSGTLLRRIRASAKGRLKQNRHPPLPKVSLLNQVGRTLPVFLVFDLFV